MNILVAVDRSDQSQNALERALEVAEIQDGKVIAVHAEETEDSASDGSKTQDRTEGGDEGEQGESILEDAAERAKQQGVAIETELLVGDPRAVIPEYADSNDIDVIYVGHRSLPQEGEPETDDEEKSLGSVANGILENSTVPVTVFDREI